MIKKGTVVAVDFDGTIVTHEYPLIGNSLPQSIETLKKIMESGGKLILLTMRSGIFLEQAVDYLIANDIELWAINKNPDQHNWTDSPKVYAQIYIDDAALGAPIIHDPSFAERPYMDWEIVNSLLFPAEI